MASQPEGAAMPNNGQLSDASLASLSARPLSFYVHVPFCASRCGYCDFNTYTAEELGPDVSRATWKTTAIQEVEFATSMLRGAPAVSTIFVGGGTPTLLPAVDLVAVVDAIRDTFGLTSDCEITTEANPDSVDQASLVELRAGGFTRISFGMQSAAPHVLRTLERTHTPGRAEAAVAMARAAGFEHVNLDLIYGTPGESLDDVRNTLAAVLSTDADHVSAYALIVEDGTRFANAVKRGLVTAPDDDDMADKYELIDSTLSAAGFDWYEVSNWARSGGACQHNIRYWKSDNWWGIGPGAHSHIGGTRWWNRKHPMAWTQAVTAGLTPAAGHEVISQEDAHVEKVLLEMRLGEGMPQSELNDEVTALINEGLLSANGTRVALTLRGRLLADAVIERLLR